MELTAAAQGLNAFFFGYDSALLGALHSVAEDVGVVMTPLMKLITLLGGEGADLLPAGAGVPVLCPQPGSGGVHLRSGVLRGADHQHHSEGQHRPAPAL